MKINKLYKNTYLYYYNKIHIYYLSIFMIYLSHLSNQNTYLLRCMYSEKKEKEAKNLKYPVLFRITHRSKTVQEGDNKEIDRLEEYYFNQCCQLLYNYYVLDTLFRQWTLDDWLYLFHYSPQRSQLYGTLLNYRNIVEQINKLGGSIKATIQ
jgi:hypothetical protein